MTQRIDKQSAAYRAGFQAGADAERDRINYVCGTDAARTLPAEAVRAALETDLDQVSASLQLSRLARLPEEERGPLETVCGGYDALLKRDAQGRTIRDDADDADGQPATASAGGADVWAAAIATANTRFDARETGQSTSRSGPSPAAASNPWASHIARVNAAHQQDV